MKVFRDLLADSLTWFHASWNLNLLDHKLINKFLGILNYGVAEHKTQLHFLALSLMMEYVRRGITSILVELNQCFPVFSSKDVFLPKWKLETYFIHKGKSLLYWEKFTAVFLYLKCSRRFRTVTHGLWSHRIATDSLMCIHCTHRGI